MGQAMEHTWHHYFDLKKTATGVRRTPWTINFQHTPKAAASRFGGNNEDAEGEDAYCDSVVEEGGPRHCSATVSWQTEQVARCY